MKNNKPKIKHATSFKLTDTALDILADLALKRGIAKSAVIENLLRDEKYRETNQHPKYGRR